MNNIMDANKEKFIELLKKVNRSGIEDLISFLESSDFFTAPDSTKSFRAYEGGLCEHALVRYDYLLKLNELSKDQEVVHDDSSYLIVGLLADLSKTNYFEQFISNKKVYTPNGSKHDNMGNFDWVAESAWKVKDADDRYVFGTLGHNAERMITEFIPLRDEESAAIIHLRSSYENPNLSIVPIYKKYPLAAMLNAAEMLTNFVSLPGDVLPF